MKKNSIKDIKLTSVDDLFETEESREDKQREKVISIPISEISDFPNHPFKVKSDNALLEMTDSIKRYGVLVPVLVRPKVIGGYEMIAGHRRKKACELSGLDTLPCIVRDLDYDTAIVTMVDSNLQRENILASEKAFAYKMKLEVMRRQVGRPTKENNYSQVGNNFLDSTSSEELASQMGDSKSQIFRFIRLTWLIKPLLDMVDNKEIALNPAVEISYLSETEQQNLYDAMQFENSTFSLSQAQILKKQSQKGKLNIDLIYSILAEEKGKVKGKFVLNRERIDRFFPKDYTKKQKEDIILQLLNDWYQNKNSK